MGYWREYEKTGCGIRSGAFRLKHGGNLSRIGYEVVPMTSIRKSSGNCEQGVPGNPGDSTDEAFLKKIDASNFDVAVVAIGTDLESKRAVYLQVKSMNIPYVIALAGNNAQAVFQPRSGPTSSLSRASDGQAPGTSAEILQDAQDFNRYSTVMVCLKWLPCPVL
jgi:hypothetical protein